MAILNFQINNIGESGQIPKFIYLDTNDNLPIVTSPGYLNQFVAQGNAVSDSDMALVSLRPTPSSRNITTRLFTVHFDSGDWNLVPSASSVEGAENLGAGEGVYAGIVSTNLTFKSLSANGGIAITSTPTEVKIQATGGLFDPSNSYTFTGDEQFDGGFGVNSGGFVSIKGTTMEVVATGNNLSVRSDTDDVQVTANNGNVSIYSLNTTISANNGLNIYTNTGGNIQVNTNSGNFQVFAGAGPTPGQISLGATDEIFIYSNTKDIGITGDLNVSISATTGNASLNAPGTNIAATNLGLLGGVVAMSGLNISNVTGDVQFGAQNGAVLIGALNNTLDLVAGTIMTLSAATKLDLSSSSIIMELITDQAPVVAAPTISLPAGFKYLVIDENVGPDQYKIYKMG